MSSISDRVDTFLLQERMISNMLDTPIALSLAVTAAVFYAGFAEIESRSGIDPVPIISPDTVLSDSEWAVIRPLFYLYCERETATHLEASRGLGVDVFGRSTSEIGQEIMQIEMELPKRAFVQGVITV
jgi:hypothetical protein